MKSICEVTSTSMPSLNRKPRLVAASSAGAIVLVGRDRDRARALRPRRRNGRCADVHARHRADPLRQLRRVPSRRRDRADVAHHLRRGASVGPGASCARSPNGVMPPWHADAPHGTFRNERGLTPAQKDLIERWAAAGAPEGNPSDLPPRADVRRRLGDRPAGCDLRDAGGLPRPRQGHDRVRALLHPDELHRREMAAGDRGAAGQSTRSCTTCSCTTRRLRMVRARRRCCSPIARTAASRP